MFIFFANVPECTQQIALANLIAANVSDGQDDVGKNEFNSLKLATALA